MAYRDYQAIILLLLRRRIERIKKRKEREKLREIYTSIREKQKVLNKFYIDYPYCEQCGCRQPKEHNCNGNKQS